MEVDPIGIGGAAGVGPGLVDVFAGEEVAVAGFEQEEFGDRVLRVVTLADRETIHNAFPDSNFKL